MNNHERILIWYRNDLRLHDHEPISQSIKQKISIIPFYCFDSRQFTNTRFGFKKTGAFRAQFLLESVQNLRHNLKKIGSNLIVRHGLPETIIPQIAKELKITTVYYHREVTAEELAVEKKLQIVLKQQKIKFIGFWGTTLYRPEDLPFTIQEIPELFTDFRQQIEQKSTIAKIFSSPQQLPNLPEIDIGVIPNLKDLGLEKPTYDGGGVLRFQGGETKALERLNEYFWQKNCLKDYKQTRNGMLGADYSSKFSPWLAHGCISPRYIYEQVQKYEQEITKNDSTYWLIFELLWRDFFRFICSKHGNKIFHLSGLQGINIPWKEDAEIFQLWQEGKTGYPLVDANMKELALTGFMSNRGRQNVASFLTKNLGINWQMGAEWFESLLIDYDVCSNWGNWNYTAGVGNDRRVFRYLNITKQSKDYDPKGDYLRHWLPQLKHIPAEKIHEPWKLNTEEQKRYFIKLSVDYPPPIVDFFKSIEINNIFS